MTEQQPAPSSGHLRNFLIILAIPVIIAAAIAWKGGLFRGTPKVAIVTSTDDPYWDRVIAGAENAARQFGMELTVVRSKADERAQSQLIRDLLAQGHVGIGVSPINAQSQTDLLRDVASRSLLVTFDSDCPDSNRLVFIGTDNYVAGRLCASSIRDAVPEGGEIIVSVGSVDKANGRDRRQGLIDGLLDRPVDPKREMDPLDGPIKGEKYTIVTTLIDGGDRAKATAMASDALAKHPGVKCFAALFGYSTPALLDALKGADKLGKIQIVAFDEAEETVAGMEAGHVFATILQDQFGMGYDTMRFFNESLRGLPRSLEAGVRMQYLPCRVINKEDAEIIRFEQQREKQTSATQPN